MCRYAPRFVREFIDAAQPYLSIGEYWDSCRYSGSDWSLDYNQGSFLEFLCAYSLKLGYCLLKDKQARCMVVETLWKLRLMIYSLE